MTKTTGLFIVGTDTEVGKTLVSGALILKLRAAGKKTIGFKPVAAGTYQNMDGIALNEDLETLRIASNLSPGELDLSSYVLDTPAAPHLVAAKNGQHLDVEKIMQAYVRLQNQADCIIVEGAGGFLVPLNDHENLSAVAQKMNLPLILVVGMKLGCINHALLTIEAMQARELHITGWIANTLSSEMSFLDENIQALQSRITTPFLGLIPTLPPELCKANNSPYSIEALTFAAEHIKLPSL